MIYVQYDPSGDGSFSTVVRCDPVVTPPIQQLLFPDGTVTDGMMLDLTQNPPVLVPIPPSE
jgi:hypothetical protein